MRRLRAYFMAVTSTLERIPAPVPPIPAKSWDGPTIDTRELYLAYNRLPADLQKQAAKSHYVCQQVLEWQRGAADRVLMAHAMLMKEMVEGLELAPHPGEVAAMFEAGVTHFVELGGKVLAPMVKRIAPDATVTSVVTPDDIDALIKEI